MTVGNKQELEITVVPEDIGSRIDTPNKNWTIDQLTDYVQQCLGEHERLQEVITRLRRNSAVALFLAGHGLELLREKLKPSSTWEQTLKDNNIAKGTANEAIRLYQKATQLWGAAAVTELRKRTITEAKIELGVIKATIKKSKHSRKKKRVVEPKPDGSPQFTRADEYLVSVEEQLQEVVKWDRRVLDEGQVEQIARRCIALLNTFLKPQGNKRITRPKRKVTAQPA